jgi:CheY-like chemotaxis protein
MKILIIDTESHRQRQLRLVLGALGHRTADVESAPELKPGLSALRARRFDLCFLSLDAGEAAVATLEAARGGFASGSVPVIVFGVDPVREKVQDAIGAGARSFVAYPFTTGGSNGPWPMRCGEPNLDNEQAARRRSHRSSGTG